MTISKDDLTELLKQAFDEGYTGYKQLRDPTAARIAEEYSNNHKEEVVVASTLSYSPSMYQGMLWATASSTGNSTITYTTN